MVEMGKLMTKLLVEVVMLKMLPAVPVETLLMLLTVPKPKEEVAIDIKFLLASVKTRELVERVAMLTLPRGVIWKKLEPDVEATAKMGKTWEEVEATTYREAPAGVEVLIKRDLAVLSQRKEAEPAVVEAPV
jgi:hypothetical protein